MRIAVIGNSGSGKSSLARAIAHLTGCRMLDLDTIAWEPHAETVLRPVGEAQAAVRGFCDKNGEWVIEGCYANLIATALEYEPRFVFLNPGLQTCLDNCRSRPWEPHKFESAEKQQRNLAPLLSWVADYYTRDGDLSLRAHMDCFAQYLGPKREFTSRLSFSPIEPELLAWLRAGVPSRSEMAG